MACGDTGSSGSGGVTQPPSPTTYLSISDGIYHDDGVTLWVEFEVTASPVNYTDTVQFQIDTVDGTATAGVHYTAIVADIASISPTVGSYLFSVTVLPGGTGDKTFTVQISDPDNATIADDTASATITYGTTPPPATDPAALSSYTGWPSAQATVYNQFADCTYRSACTGFAGAAVISCHEWIDKNNITRYDAKKLYEDSGGDPCAGCTGSCTGFYSSSVMDYLISTGAKVKDSSPAVFRKLECWKQIGGATKAEILAKVKRAVYYNGCVWVDSIWYSNWNTSGSQTPNFIMRNNGSTTSCTGHSYVIVGWSNNIAGTGTGGFRVQSSHGVNWGDNGRMWLPYSYIDPFAVRNSDGSSCVPDPPWYRFFKVLPDVSTGTNIPDNAPTACV